MGKILLSGWFSFNNMGTTAGDIIVCKLVAHWLEKAEMHFTVASLQPTLPGTNWEEEDPSSYTHVFFVCGPFGNGWPVTEFLEKFKNSIWVGLNLSMLQPLHEWNPFDFLIERDSNLALNPDFTFGAKLHKVPVVGLIKAHKQKEYGSKSKHEIVHSAVENFLANQEVAVIPIDTSLEGNLYGLKSYSEIESLIAQTDVVITTRLHGMVLSLKNGVPALAIDPIAGGAKITKQAKAIGWPNVLVVEDMEGNKLQKAFKYCLTDQAKHKAKASALIGAKKVETFEESLNLYLQQFKLANRNG